MQNLIQFFFYFKALKEVCFFKECAVCGEKFEQFYDDDEENWKMRNAISIRGKVCRLIFLNHLEENFNGVFLL